MKCTLVCVCTSFWWLTMEVRGSLELTQAPSSCVWQDALTLYWDPSTLCLRAARFPYRSVLLSSQSENQWHGAWEHRPDPKRDPSATALCSEAGGSRRGLQGQHGVLIWILSFEVTRGLKSLGVLQEERGSQEAGLSVPGFWRLMLRHEWKGQVALRACERASSHDSAWHTWMCRRAPHRATTSRDSASILPSGWISWWKAGFISGYAVAPGAVRMAGLVRW